MLTGKAYLPAMTLCLHWLPSLYMITEKAEPVGLWHWDSKYYALLCMLTGNAEPTGLWHWDSTNYLLSACWQVIPNLLEYYTETLQPPLYSTRWQGRTIPLDNDTETLRIPLTLLDESEHVGLVHWESTNYLLICTMTGTRARWTRTLRLYRLLSTTHDEGKAESVGLWHWESPTTF